MDFRPFDRERDREAVQRIWREVGWFPPDGTQNEEALDWYLDCGYTLLATLDGMPECLVVELPGTMRYLEKDLPFSGIGSVATSPVARRQGLARQLLARVIADSAAHGAPVSGLGVFDQGFYNRLGYGTGAYEHRLAFDPAQLKVDRSLRPPRRITVDDWEAVHASRLQRWRGHGSLCLTPPATTRAEMAWRSKSLGFGYFDGPGGALSHHVWCRTEHMGSGPYQVAWMAYQNGDQFLELMAFLASMADQTTSIHLREPQSIQLQDLLDRPFRHRALTEKSRFESSMRAVAYQQMRILDLAGCLERTHLRGPEVRFHLELRDPIEALLDGTTPWRGVGGNYIVTLGPSSAAERGATPDLPHLRCSVNAFTRMWLGVRPATGLAVTDDLAGPDELLEQLDWALRLPAPKPDWDF